MRTRTETGDPTGGVVLTAFLGVSALADVSPLLKLRPPSVVLEALVGTAEGARTSVVFALFGTIVLAGPAFAGWWVVRRLPLPEGRRALITQALLVAAMFGAAWLLASRATALHAIGRGSDQEACITMPARGLLAGRWPYERALIWSGNPCSPGLGWILLATPFVLLSSYAGFLVAGAAAFLFVPGRVLAPRAKLLTVALTLACATAWQSLATGADALAIGIGLALLTALVEERRLTVLVAVLAGLVGSARLTLAFFPFVLAASLYANGAQEKTRARTFAGVAIGTLALAHAIPLAIDARSYLQDGPAHVLRLSEGLRRANRATAVIFGVCGVAWIAYAIGAARRAFAATTPAPTLLARQFDVATLTLLSVLAPALADLLVRLHAPAGFELDPATWRGGNWLLLALPSYAACVAIAFAPPATTRCPHSPARS